ncbi:5'/3'-nucleotidase SurE [Acidobacteriia bacterium AH_259_A11_L15]|nr:5'/3'-nucleotidase SurE [Acidobacteriia bacterium AH_259_A11_L15]
MKLGRNRVWLVTLAIILLSPGGYRTLAEPDAPFTILLSNDDGFDSPGLQALVEALAPVARVVVAAPATEQSGSGHGITYREPIFFHQIKLSAGVSGYAIQARPATCVRVGVESLLESKPDLVISGINRGPNLGIVTFYSGTVGAARQGALLGIPAIAVSMQGDDPDDLATAASFIWQLVRHLRAQHVLRPGLLLNVNVPAGNQHGVRVVRQSIAPDRESYERRTSPRGAEYLWSRWTPPADQDEMTDVGAFAQNFITITPLRIDQTDARELDSLGKLELEELVPISRDAATREGFARGKN